MKKQVSFDYDGCLSLPHVQDFVSQLMQRPDVEVWVVTSRRREKKNEPTRNDDLYETTDRLGIPRDRIFYTFPNFKNFFFKNARHFAFHVDNDSCELRLIRKLNLDVVTINCMFPSYRRACESILNKP